MMKRFFNLALVATVAMMMASCMSINLGENGGVDKTPTQVTGINQVTTMNQFDKVEIGGAFKVIYEQSSGNCSVRIEASEQALKEMTVYVKDGQLRIVRVYMPCDSTGTHPVVGGEELPGSEYTTPGEIAALTTDDSTYYHGTHTTGTAAGSFMDNGLHGVATGAQIVACGMPDEELTDFNVANSIKYIFDYADKVGLPAVINMSIGSQDGAHDGTSPLCQLFKEASAPGRICVVSAGP